MSTVPLASGGPCQGGGRAQSARTSLSLSLSPSLRKLPVRPGPAGGTSLLPPAALARGAGARRAREPLSLSLSLSLKTARPARTRQRHVPLASGGPCQGGGRSQSARTSLSLSLSLKTARPARTRRRHPISSERVMRVLLLIIFCCSFFQKKYERDKGTCG